MPTLLFVHGHPFDHSMWQPQIDHFAAKGWRVLAPDLRGYGVAPVTPGAVTLPEFAADLIALLDTGDSDEDELGEGSAKDVRSGSIALGAIGPGASGPERIVVCGLSMGGQIAMELVHSYPERIAALILADTSPAAETAQGKADRRRIADDITENGMAAYAEELLPRMLAPSTIRNRPDLATYVRDMMGRARALGAAAALRGRAERRDYGATLLTLDLPTLVIVGREDAFTPVDEAEATAKMLRNGRLVVIDDAGHMPNLEATDAFNTAIDSFLASAVHTTEPTGRR